MRESKLTLAMNQTPGRIVEYYGWGVRGAFSSTADEILHLAGGVGYLDASFWGRLEVKGRDALDLLHRLSTNDLAGVQPGSAVGAILTTDKGRIEALLIVARLKDRLLVIVPPGSEERTVSWIQKYTIMEDITIRDVTTDTIMASLVGDKLSSMVLRRFGFETQSQGVRLVDLPWGEVLAVRIDIATFPQLFLIADSERAESFFIWLEALADAEGWKRTGIHAFETYRISRGLPMTGHELTGDFNPYDVNLLGFVSYTKGCYIGQEVIARIDTYQKDRYGLRGILLEGPADAGLLPMEIMKENEIVGWLTSSSTVAMQPYYPGLAVVRNNIQSGTPVRISAVGLHIAGTVVDLPLKLETE
jgi:tRNA-modifying protein YgfZ